MKYCVKCGQQIRNKALICSHCECQVQANAVKPGSRGLQIATKIFLILTVVLEEIIFIANLFTVFIAGLIFCLILLMIAMLMTANYFKATSKNQSVSIGFKVCTLLFVSMIAGILMLCDKNN